MDRSDIRLLTGGNDLVFTPGVWDGLCVPQVQRSGSGHAFSAGIPSSRVAQIWCACDNIAPQNEHEATKVS
jgi:hypothetical protein